MDNLNLIRQVISWNTAAGFIQAYESNLSSLGAPALAYEATEKEFEQYYDRRKYRDRDVFYSALSRHYRKQKRQTPPP